MGDNGVTVVRYSYCHDRFSEAAVRHAFRYIGAVTGIRFLIDAIAPDILSHPDTNAPASTKLVIRISGDGQRCVYFREEASSDSWRPTLTYDPIEAILDRLTLSARTGPYAGNTTAPPAPQTITLSTSITDLMTALSSAGIVGKRRRFVTLWPGGAKFAITVSHDIDIAKRSVPGSLKLLFNPKLPGKFAGLLDSIRSAIGLRRNPFDCFSDWIEAENALGIKSTFFIFSGERRHKSDPVYALETLKEGIRQLSHQGFEIALHTSIGSHEGQGFSDARNDLSRFCGTDVCGLRPHYLSAFFPAYWKAAAKAGFLFSSALGFDDRIGFFEGIDLPIVPFDRDDDQAIEIVEIPIAIMDCGMIGQRHANSEGTLSLGRQFIERIESTGALLTLDWHQRTFYNRDYPGWATLYLKIIEYARDKGTCFMTMRDVVSLLRKRLQESA